MNYFMPTRLFTGEHCIAKNVDVLKALGSSCLIITEKGAAEASGALADLKEALDSASITSQVFFGVRENPPLAIVAEAGRMAADLNVDFVVGLGGGSSQDAAKAAAVFASNPTLDEDAFYGFKWEVAPKPIVLVGTTSGTGSEVTKVSVLTDSKERKHSIHDDRLYATVSFGDPRHTHTCPKVTTLSCGVDILAHAVEAYFSHKADEISRAFSVRAVRLAFAPLAAAAAGEALDADQRRDLYEASILGGLAINTCGTCFPHNVGYYLTENYHVPHGYASAVFMPDMLELCRDQHPAYTQDFFDALGHTQQELVKLVTDAIGDLAITMDTQEIEAALPRWEGNGSVKNTLADVTTDDIRRILTDHFVA